MEIQQLKHFLAAVDCGNLGRAAETLNISQSGLSRSIKTLEDAVGVPLLIRTSRGVELTSIGKTLVPRARAALNQVGRARQELASAKKSLAGQISIGVTSNFAHYLFCDVIAKLNRDIPGIEFSIRSGGFDRLIEQLKLAEIDLIFGLIRPEHIDGDVTVDQLFVARSGVYAHPEHRLARKANVELAEFVDEPWGLIDSEGFLGEFTTFFGRRGIKPPRPQLVTNSFSLLRDAVINMRLLTVLPEGFAKPSVQAGMLQKIACETPTDFARVCVLYRPDSLDIPIVETAVKHIKRYAPTLHIDPGPS